LAACASPSSPREPADTARYTPGVSYFGRNHYIEYIAGELPVILSAPHGGSLRPAEIPDRTYGTTVTDLNTGELARAVDSALVRLTGKHAHVVIVRLHRVKLDANRDLTEGAQGDAEAALAWEEFHRFLTDAKNAVNQRSAGGLYLDLHGHGHTIQRLELGYLLGAEELGQPDDSLDGQAAYEVSSSIRTLSLRSPLSFAELLRGPSSLGALLESEGFPAVPSSANPDPGDDEYFAGGYNTAVHGCRGGGQICAVQIESNRIGVRDTEGNRAEFAAALARVINQYLELHYAIDITP
jgi:N-formylglutamate amidohydrolase